MWVERGWVGTGLSAAAFAIGRLAGMGYNPHRRRVKRRTDVVFLGASIVVAVLLVVWALVPR
jgi:hypothetical protein